MLLYRGFNNNYPNMGVRPNQKGIWMTDDEEYANEYSKLFKNGAIAEIDIDDNANIANVYDCREVFEDEEDIEEYLYDLGGDLEFDNQVCDKLLEAGYDGLFFDDYGKDCYYIFNSKVIKGYKIIKTFQNDREDAMESTINNILKNAGVKQLNESDNFEIRTDDEVMGGRMTLLQNGYSKATMTYTVYGDFIVIEWIESFSENKGYATKLLTYFKNNIKKKYPNAEEIGAEVVSTRILNVMKNVFGEPLSCDMPRAKDYDEYLEDESKSGDVQFKLNESIFWKGEKINNYEQGYYPWPEDNKEYDPKDEMIVWKNPSAEWMKYQIDAGNYFRFTYITITDTLFVWYGDDGFHRDTMDITGVDGDVVGTMTRNNIDYWADDDDSPVLGDKLFRKKREKFLKTIYPNGYTIGVQY